MLKIKIRKLCTVHRIFALTALSVLMVISVKFPILAQAVTQGYGSDQSLQRGMLVQLKESDASKVEAVKQAVADKTFGVVVDANDAPVTLSSDGKKVFIATAGKFDALVSSQNGEIKAGDYIAVSAVDGIGMKASDKEAVVVGRALSGFDGKSNAISTLGVKSSDGSTQKVNIGRVSADVSVSKNPLFKATEPNLPEALRRATEAIAGKPVNAVRAYIAVFVFLITAITSATLMLGGVRSAIISIGRNPLGKKTIIRGMFQVIITGMIIFITGVFGVYLLLKI